MRTLAIVFGLFSLAAGIAAASPVATPSHYSLQHHVVSTANAEAQAAFDEGLTLLYAFNREAARLAFERAAAADPKLAMAYWGVAESWGPNVNVAIDNAGERAAYDAVEKAKALEAGASEEEIAYIDALSTRYSNAPHPPFAALAQAYKHAMGDLTHRYPDDLDAATLYAESEMDLHAWQWFTPAGQPAEGTNDIIATLESVLARDPMHIGANHFYVHATEESLHPERAVLSAQRLGTFLFEPAAAHLVHMPAHTFERTGFYDQAALSNARATDLDRAYLAGLQDQEAGSYYVHDLTFLASAYQMEGNFAGAQQTGVQLAKEGAWVPSVFVLCRFARWHDILALSEPKADPNEQIRRGMWQFARGLAYAGLGDAANAQKERQVLAETARTLDVPAVVGWYNSSKSIFALALDVLDAKIALARGHAGAAIPFLARAAHNQDALIYIEPPDWYYPVRESLGAAQLRAGDAKGAERTFRDDLARNPRSGRSLFGLAESLKAQGDAADASWVRRQFVDAWQHADIELSIDRL